MGVYWEYMKSSNNANLMMRIGLCRQEELYYSLDKAFKFILNIYVSLKLIAKALTIMPSSKTFIVFSLFLYAHMGIE